MQDLIRDSNVDFVGILETIKHDFSAGLLHSLSGQKKLKWEWLLSCGRSGGILVGVNIYKLSFVNVTMENFRIRLKL